MNKYFVVLLCSVCVLSSCENKIKVKARFGNGQPKLINYFSSQDKKYFEQKEFDSNGHLIRTRTFINGKEEGFEYCYRVNGQLAAEMMFKNGERNGITHEYHLNGKLAFEGYCYPDSGFCGLSTWYYNNGQIQSTGIRRKDNAIGVWTDYYRNGKKKKVANYGGLNNTIYYDTTGKEISKEEYYKINQDD
jgi:antitoxin component YwqK of YwqJK toxin-antitoxin module